MVRLPAGRGRDYFVSINSPSGEGGGADMIIVRHVRYHENVSINSPSGEGGGSQLQSERNLPNKFPLILLQAKAGGVVNGVVSLFHTYRFH